ncbi:MAG: hypothetical protein ACR2MO_14590 [Acidimicrobiales bacterium]
MGSWATSPIGAFTDVFWASPDGERVLLVGTERAARFVSAVYGFDRIDVVTMHVAHTGTTLDVEAGQVRVHLGAGPAGASRWRTCAHPLSPAGLRDRWRAWPSGCAPSASARRACGSGTPPTSTAG